MKKRLISVCLILAMLLTVALGAASVGAAQVPGDADGDEELAILDATAIQRHLAGIAKLSEDAVRRSMVSGEPELCILDATMIQRKLAGIISEFPADIPSGDPLPELPTEVPAETPTDVAPSEQIVPIPGPDDPQPVTPTDVPAEAPTDIAPTEQIEPVPVPPTDAPSEAPTGTVDVPPTEPATQPAQEVTKMPDEITIYFSNSLKWKTVNAYLYHTFTGESNAKWPGEAMELLKTNDFGEEVYSLIVDTTKFDRIIFNSGSGSTAVQSTNIPLTKASSGFFLYSDKTYSGKYLAGVYPYGVENPDLHPVTVTMDYPDGYKKKVYIWTPADYDPADTAKKYPVIYMCDGQNLFGQAETLSGYEWECDETIQSLICNGGEGAIVVGVEAGNTEAKRNHELTPNLGEVADIAGENMATFRNGGGKVFSDFMVDTVIPYVEENYNTGSDRAIVGSSSGGIEAFYIGMEHPDKFRFIGALSPAFLLYDEETWDSYLDTKDFSKDTPRVYLYCGNSADDPLEQALYPDSVAMEDWLKAKGYPQTSVRTDRDEDAVHNEGFWALYFPQALCWGMDL